MDSLFYLIPVFGVLALAYTFIMGSWVSKQSAGNDRMKEISGHIANGAMAFLKAEYKILTYFVILASMLLGTHHQLLLPNLAHNLVSQEKPLKLASE